MPELYKVANQSIFECRDKFGNIVARWISYPNDACNPGTGGFDASHEIQRTKEEYEAEQFRLREETVLRLKAQGRL